MARLKFIVILKRDLYVDVDTDLEDGKTLSGYSYAKTSIYY